MVVVRGQADRKALAEALALAKRHASDGSDPTQGALYFVNPRLMDPGNCPWFARRKRTATIGQHVFLTEYGPDEQRGAPGLDCSIAGIDRGQGPAGALQDRTLRAGWAQDRHPDADAGDAGRLASDRSARRAGAGAEALFCAQLADGGLSASPGPARTSDG